MKRPQIRARIRSRRKPGEMTELELAYSERLKEDREIHLVLYEPFKLRLAIRTWYTPDFLVLRKASDPEKWEEEPAVVLELHEVKAAWSDESRVKLKVAAEAFPFFDFYAAVGRRLPKRDGGGVEWKVDRISTR